MVTDLCGVLAIRYLAKALDCSSELSGMEYDFANIILLSHFGLCEKQVCMEVRKPLKGR